jgi:transcriptional regulator with XRE-family HTH domain
MLNALDAAALIRNARERARLSQRALATRAGTTQSVIARIELGRASPTIHTVNRLLEAAGQRLDVRLVSTAGQITALARDFFDRQQDRGIVSAYLYGSTASGSRHAESDVDIGVLLDRARFPRREERSELRVRLGSELIAALATDEVDLVVLNDLPPGLARTIMLDGKRLALFQPEADHAFSRDVQLRWADLQPFLRRAARVKRQALTR